jgi:glycosyltransferase involved in cell wall biosynthesis
MIVKNESKIIKRLFDSVIDIIDSYCICDTGSTDNTVEMIEEYFKNKNIPGRIVHEPFKNFSHNRTFALQSAVGLSDYLLLIDADMVLEVNNFNKNILKTADSFHILQGNDSFYYQNLRIIKNNGLFKYFGVTHEYIDTPSGTTVYSFEKKDLFIRDIGDGGSKNDKFQRDIRLLLDGLKENPKCERYHFYLANSYFDTGNFEEALKYYTKRIELGGWQEEVWYSYFRKGTCLKNLGKLGEAFLVWLEGYEYYPDRLEAIYEIILHYRCNSKHKLCEIYYNIAKNVLDKKLKRDGYLFLHDDIYTFKIFYEFTIFAAYNGINNINDEIIKILNHSNDHNINNNLLSNMKFYKDILKKKKTFVFDNIITHKVDNEDKPFLSSSSCLIKNGNDGYKMNIRYVNYYIQENGNYINCEKNIISMNKYLELDDQFKTKNELYMDLVVDDRLYNGVEDVKIYYDKYTDTLKYLGTGYHLNNSLGIVSGKYDLESKKLEVNELRQTFNNSNCEKNWVFVDYKDELYIIYDWFPMKICKLENNHLNIMEIKNTPKFFSRVRGSTCGFNYIKNISESNNGNISINISEKEIWFVCHIVSYESPRHYYHIICVFDSNMNLLRYSAPFKFEGEPIEYCLSIVVEDEQVLINYSTWDRTTRIGVYDKNYIESLLKYK